MSLANKRVHPAHEGDNFYAEESMTYREWLAGIAMQGLLSNSRLADIPELPNTVAKWSLQHADALIKRMGESK
jgi:hypothetical protein